jgi:predicted secreted protein
MAWFSGIVVFLLTWWTMLFTVLPFSLKRDETGKPDDPKLWQKFLITTALSMVLWGVIFGLVSSNLISFHDMAEHIAQEDMKK